MAARSLLIIFVVLCCCFRSDGSTTLADTLAAPQILDINPSREMKNASLDDSLFKQALWNGVKQRGPAASKFVRNGVIDYSLQKRSSKLQKRAGSALISFPQCLSCSNQAQTKGAVNMGMFSAAQLLTKMTTFATIGDCLFYGQRAQGSNPRSLSRSAQDYTCLHMYQYRCIWDLWPYDPDSCQRDENYYCLDPYRDPSDPNYPCCWLSPLMNGATTKDERIDKAMLYFQQMSQAMAMTCTGNVYILSENVNTITQQSLKQKGVVKSLIAITGTIGAWTGSEDVSHYLNTGSTSKREMPEPTEFTKEVARAIMEKRKQLLDAGYPLHNVTEALNHLGKRACGNAASFENPNGDYFG